MSEREATRIPDTHDVSRSDAHAVDGGFSTMHERIVWCMPSFRPFGEVVADALGCPLIVNGPAPDCDAVHVVGMADPPSYTHTVASTRRAGRRVIHWCGPDVLRLWRPDLIPEATHVCDADNLREELAHLGIEAGVAPLPAKYRVEVTPLPATSTVSMFTGDDPLRYGATMLRALKDAMPEVRFWDYRQGSHDAEGMRRLIGGTSVYLRLTQHDGGALSAKEYMAAGRRVVITADLPHAVKVAHDDFTGVVAALRRALAADEPDDEAAAYWTEQNDPARFLSDLEAAT